MSDELTVLVYADDGFAPHVATTLLSIRDTTAGPLHCIVGSVGISEPNRDRITASVPDCRVSWIDVPAEWLASLTPTTGPRVNYAGLYALENLPGGIDRVLCIDVDVVVRHDLRQLWSIDLGDTALAAARCGWGLWTGRGLSNWRELGIDGNRKYLQSGVMLVDMDRWRGRELFARCLDYIHRWHPTMALCDQDALNGIIDDDWVEVPLRWNWVVFPGSMDNELLPLAVPRAELDEARTDPAVVHFAGRKPWRWDDPTRETLPWLDEWESVAMRTEFADWYAERRRIGLATRDSVPSRRRSPLRRLRRAASVLLHG